MSLESLDSILNEIDFVLYNKPPSTAPLPSQPTASSSPPPPTNNKNPQRIRDAKSSSFDEAYSQTISQEGATARRSNTLDSYSIKQIEHYNPNGAGAANNNITRSVSANPTATKPRTNSDATPSRSNSGGSISNNYYNDDSCIDPPAGRKRSLSRTIAYTNIHTNTEEIDNNSNNNNNNNALRNPKPPQHLKTPQQRIMQPLQRKDSYLLDEILNEIHNAYDHTK